MKCGARKSVNKMDDYAHYTTEAEVLLKRARQACQDKKWDAAAKFALQLARCALGLLKEARAHG